MREVAKKLCIILSIAIFAFFAVSLYVAAVRRQEAAKRARIEGFNIKKAMRMIPIVGKVMASAIKMITTVPKRIAILVKSIKLVGGGIWHGLGAVGKSTVMFAKDAGTVMECGVHIMSNLPNCWMFYLLDFTALTLYGIFVDLPVYCIDTFLGINVNPALDVFFDTLNFGDKMVHDATGYHAIHYPDSITRMCYKCKMPDSKHIGEAKRLFARPTHDLTKAGNLFVKVFTG